MESAQKMLAVCMAMAPTGREQQAFSELYRRLDTESRRLDDDGEEFVVRQLAITLYMGLSIGLWPELTIDAHLNHQVMQWETDGGRVHP